MIGTGAAALRSIGSPSRAQRLDQLVVHDLDDQLAGRHRLDDLDADRAGLHLVGEGAHHVERDVGLEQRAAHLAQRRVDVGLGQRAAPRQAVENAAKPFRQTSRTSLLCLILGVAKRRLEDGASRRHETPPAPREPPNTYGARGRIALSGGGLRPHGTGRRAAIPALCESARNLWVRPPRSQGNRRKPCVLPASLGALTGRAALPLGFGASRHSRSAGRIRA